MESEVRNKSKSKQSSVDGKDVSNGSCEKERAKVAENPLVESEPKRYKRDEVAAKLPDWEIYFFTFFMTACFATSAYSLYNFSKKLENTKEYYHMLRPGWKVLGRLKDFADFEWYLMYNDFFKMVTVAIIHAVTSFLAHQYAFRYRRHVWTVVGIGAMFWILGWRAVLFTWGLTTAFYAATFLNSVLFCWACGLGALTAMNFDSASWMAMLVEEGNFENLGSFITALAFVVIKLISFSVESAKRQNGTSEMDPAVTFTYFDIIVYTFYFPCFYTGPNFIYKYFQPQIIKPKRAWQREEVAYIVQKFVRSIFWMIFLEIFQHFIYVHSCGQDVDILENLPPWSLGAIVLYSASFYQAKYCVSYGLPSCFMMLDHIVPPTNPRCIVRVAYFSEYWRFFDPGLHAFFRNYVYIPIGGSRHGYLRQAVATFASFCFVCYWHGGYSYLMLWTMSNCLAIGIEIAARKAVRFPAVAQFEEKYFGPAMTRRVHAMCNVPLYIFSTNAIMIFYITHTNAAVLFRRLILAGSLTTWLVICVFFYSMTLFSHEVERWEQEQMRKDKKG